MAAAPPAAAVQSGASTIVSQGGVTSTPAAATAATGATAAAPAASTSTTTAAGAHTGANNFFHCCPGCGCCPADCGCCPGCGTLCCITHDYLICCGLTGTVVCLGAAAGAAGGGGGGGEYGQICGECETNAAILKCTECNEIYCQPCYDRIHAKGKWVNSGKKGHRATRHLPQSIQYLVSEQERQYFMAAEQPCGECSTEEQQVRATVFCLDCKEVYCHGCKVKVHSKGLRQNHKRFVPLVAGEEQLDDDHLNKNWPPKPPAYERGDPRPKWQEHEDELLPGDAQPDGDAPDQS